MKMPRKEFPNPQHPKLPLERNLLEIPVVALVFVIGIWAGFAAKDLKTVTSCMENHRMQVDQITYYCMTHSQLKDYQLRSAAIPYNESWEEFELPRDRQEREILKRKLEEYERIFNEQGRGDIIRDPGKYM